MLTVELSTCQASACQPVFTGAGRVLNGVELCVADLTMAFSSLDMVFGYMVSVVFLRYANSWTSVTNSIVSIPESTGLNHADDK